MIPCSTLSAFHSPNQAFLAMPSPGSLYKHREVKALWVACCSSPDPHPHLVHRDGSLTNHWDGDRACESPQEILSKEVTAPLSSLPQNKRNNCRAASSVLERYCMRSKHTDMTSVSLVNFKELLFSEHLFKNKTYLFL